MWNAKKKNPRHARQSEAARIAEPSAWNALEGALEHGSKGAAMGALAGGASQGLGDLLLGQPEEHSFGAEAGRGALGGGRVGAGLGTYSVGKHPAGMSLVRFLMSKGLGPKAATLAALGSGALVGGASGALGGGLNSGLSNWVPEEK